MFYSPDVIIDQVRYWAVVHPEPVQQILDAAEQIHQGSVPAPSWAGLTDPATTAEVVRKQIEYAVLDSTEATASVRSAAYRQIHGALVQAIQANLPSYLDHFYGVFDTAATAYTKALEDLPEQPFTAAQIVQGFSPKQTSAYRSAQEAVSKLEGIQSWLQGLKDVVRTEKFDGSPVFLLLDPGSVKGMAEVMLADYSDLDPMYREINPALANGLRSGGTLRLALPSDAAADIAEYEAQRQAMPNAEWLAIRRSVESR